MPELIAIGTTEANSADFTLTGEATSLVLKSASPPEVPFDAVAKIQAKMSDGSYFNIGELSSRAPMLVLSAPGVFRVQRKAGAAFGVDRS